jgi:CubicO group peptidase (beta-lactamase class C family)
MNGLKHTLRIVGALLLAAAAPGVTLAAGPPPEAPGERQRAVDFTDLEKVIEAELKETGTPGAAVAVISDGRVVFAKGVGTTSVEAGGVPVTPDTLFRLGSTTKMFTGAAMLTLAEQGKVKLDMPIGDYAKGLAPKLSRLTAHQLLSNTAGVGDFAAPFVSQEDSALATMARGWRDDVLFADAGKIYSYSSPGFWLAGYVVEEAGGKPYADVMEERLFKPLGMTRTTFSSSSTLTGFVCWCAGARRAPQRASSSASRGKRRARFVGVLRFVRVLRGIMRRKVNNSERVIENL